MKYRILILEIVAAMALSGQMAMAQLDIEVIPAISPNLPYSPSSSTWESNAMNALKNNLSSYGTPNTPGFYQALSPTASIPITDNLVTGFPSWLGSADPGTAFGPQYANEEGNRLSLGFHITGENNTTFCVTNLDMSMVSSDPGGTMNWTWSKDYSPSGFDSYSSNLVGVIYHTDGPNTYIDSGPGTQMVNELLYVGASNAWDVYDVSPGDTRQAKLDYVINGHWMDTGYGATSNGTIYTLGSALTINSIYTVPASDNSKGQAFTGSVTTAVVVPEPGTLALLAFGSLAVLRRRRKKRAA